MSEPIRTIYRQLRRNLPAHADIMKKVEEIASRTSVNSAHPRPSGVPVESGGSEISHFYMIKSQAGTLRRAFNRLYFMESNLLNFDHEKLINAKQAFQNAKNMMEGEDSRLGHITMLVEDYLTSRKYLFV